MAGRRRTGSALAGAANVATKLLLLRDEEQRNRREKAAELKLRFESDLALESAKKGRAYVNPFTGQSVSAVTPASTVPSGLVPKSYKDPITGIEYGLPPKPAEPKFLTEDRASQVLSTAQAGTPLSAVRSIVDRAGNERTVSNIPTSPAGINTLNRAIAGGITESPAATDLGLRITPESIPAGPFVEGPDGTYIGGQFETPPTNPVPRQRVVDLVRSGPASFSASSRNVSTIPPSPRSGLGVDTPPVAAGENYSQLSDDQLADLAESGDLNALNELRRRGVIR